MTRLISLLLIFCALLCGCTIEKRHYRSGWYVGCTKEQVDVKISPFPRYQCSFIGENAPTHVLRVDCVMIEGKIPNTIHAYTFPQYNDEVIKRKILPASTAPEMDSGRSKNLSIIPNRTSPDETPHESREWIWPLVVTEILILSFFLLLATGGQILFVLGLTLLILGIAGIVFSCVKIIQGFRTRKKENIIQTLRHQFLIFLAIAVTLFNIFFATLQLYINRIIRF